MKFVRTIPHVKPVPVTSLKHGDKFMTGGEPAVLLEWKFDPKRQNEINVKAISLARPDEPFIGFWLANDRCLKYLGHVVPRKLAGAAAA